jgi:carbon-monoxide dehydrogenase large subunit
VLNPIPCAWIIPNSDVKAIPYLPLAKDIVRYVGEGVAVVVAESRYQAEDALERINVQYQPLPVVINPEAAMQPGAPQLHRDAPNHQAFHWVASGGDVDAAFASAEVVVRDTIIQQNLIPNAIEPRSAIASYLSSMGQLTLWNTTQNPHITRFI